MFSQTGKLSFYTRTAADSALIANIVILFVAHSIGQTLVLCGILEGCR